MKIQILQSDLSKNLAIASRMTASRGQLPILANVLLVAQKTGLQVSATNLETGLRLNVGGKVIEEGNLTIPAKTLAEFVATLEAGTLEITTDGDKLKISSPHTAATFSGIPASEFPILPELNSSETNIALPADMITRIAKQVAIAAATDESRPVLTGLQFKVNEQRLLITATDGFRMSQLIVNNSQFKINNSLILPVRPILELERFFQTGVKEAKMQLVGSGNQIIFSLPDVDLISRVIEGNFPDVAKIIPIDSSTALTIDRQELLQAVKTANIFARENNNLIKFQVAKDTVTVSAVASNMGENSTDVDAEVDGEGGVISFNCKFVLDYLNSTSAERIILKMSGPTAPGVWQSEKETDLVHLIMPVRVQQ